jgi:hypothetical protein
MIVAERPMLSTMSAPAMKPVILPRIPALVTHPAALARTRVGNSSDRWAAKAGVSMEIPKLATNIDGARIHPLGWV